MGTTSVLAPLLPIPDDLTRPLMQTLHRALKSGQPPSDALATAQATATGGLARLAAAAFVCLGAGG
jgi:hypothetical protein